MWVFDAGTVMTKLIPEDAIVFDKPARVMRDRPDASDVSTRGVADDSVSAA